ncbi:protein DBF4 homolog A-like [Littorina saxatilis]|uniref:protein DBF4 homolog A-like n=1 Tax=Littorina saxatilis TaxID=31220 RepID=UPI0038B4FE6D
MGEGESTCQRRVSSKGKRFVSVAHSSAAFNLNTLSRNLCTFSSKKQLHEAKKSLLCYVSNMNRSRRASAKQKKAVQQESGREKDGGKSGRKLALSGKVVYLDIKDSRQAQSIGNKLKKLGAVVETFLSKDLNYVISSTPPSRSNSQPKGHCDGLGPESPSFANTPSPYSSVPSPTYTNVGGKIVPVTRGQAMLQIARSRTRSPSPSSVVASAEKLGIKIISIEGAEKWLNKELNKLGHSEADDAAEQQWYLRCTSINNTVECPRLLQVPPAQHTPPPTAPKAPILLVKGLLVNTIVATSAL